MTFSRDLSQAYIGQMYRQSLSDTVKMILLVVKDPGGGHRVIYKFMGHFSAYGFTDEFNYAKKHIIKPVSSDEPRKTRSGKIVPHQHPRYDQRAGKEDIVNGRNCWSTHVLPLTLACLLPRPII